MRHFNILFIMLVISVLTACGTKDENTGSEELVPLEVEFSVPETAEVDEEVKLIATVTYGEESVTEADEVTFELWEQGMEDESTMIEATNKGDGTYTTETTFDHDGIYEMFAHVTAKDMHTMPKKLITIGEGASSNQDQEHEHSEHADGFAMHFVEPELVTAAEETSLKVHVQLDDQPLEEASIRFEIWNEETPDNHEWVDASEATAGEYSENFAFPKAGTYQMVIHVENEDGLHEHQEFEINVAE
ncbi:FixH family protein [Oceanobacillus chungangensis]|uniref:YtkA-like domain-containing protein n=1 Tax=Oceanobacillus chungangensis TaxID=1229152 RepID=A0A3D8PLS9_9BACI|nr:FixH family protein [Oceanobacillus chungangensis]RDW17086.1 hypothetical protein CWR45_13215 [Oceanobacillus chungangensis]